MSHIEITATKPKMFLGEIRLYDAAGSEIRLFAEDEAAERLIDEANLPMIDNSYLYNSYFDEIYHARTAYEHILNIYPMRYLIRLWENHNRDGDRLFGFNPLAGAFRHSLRHPDAALYISS